MTKTILVANNGSNTIYKFTIRFVEFDQLLPPLRHHLINDGLDTFSF